MRKTSIASLKERLSNWQDWDGAAYEVGACLGFWPEFGAPVSCEGHFDSWHGVKGVFWSANPLGKALHNFLVSLVKSGCLETRNDESEFRWNPNYKGDADHDTL